MRLLTFLSLAAVALAGQTIAASPAVQPFQRIDGCRWKADRWNDGDSFHVVTGDAVALYFAVYNLVRKHISLDGQTPAQAAGVEQDRWTMEDVVAETARYWQAKEEAQFLVAFEAAGL